jgi:hypothetical protein
MGEHVMQFDFMDYLVSDALWNQRYQRTWNRIDAEPDKSVFARQKIPVTSALS